MKKIFIFTLMVIGYMSFTLSTNPHISSSTSSSEFNSQVTSTVNSGAVNSELLKTTASNASFLVERHDTSYVDPLTNQLYAAGRNYNGSLGLGYDEDGNLITAKQESFTPLYKSGDVNDKFINPIDWSIGIGVSSAIIDADGKLWTAGGQASGSSGTGVIDADINQYTFELVAGLPEGYNAVKVVTGTNQTIVMLDDGTIWGAGHRSSLALSSTGGYTTDGVEGGAYYHTFIQIDNTSEDDRVAYEMPFATSNIVDIKTGYYQTLYLLEDGSLYRCNANGYTLLSTDVISFDVVRYPSYFVTESGDVYYASTATAAYTQILSAGDYEGTIDSVYATGSSGGWAYLTTDGDVYFCNTHGGTDLFKIAEDVIYFGMGGYSEATFGAITSSSEFKLWGTDYYGMLGNGATDGAVGDCTNPETLLDAFYSDKATPSTPTTDGTLVTPPALDPETGELQKDEDGNNVAIIPTLQTPAPANF